MEWQGHALLGLRAAEGLPDWEIEKLASTSMSAEAIGRAYMPAIRTVREKLGAYCLILDWVYQKEFEKYARMPDGKWVPHSPLTGNGGSFSFTANTALIANLMNHLIRELRAGNWDEAICWAGVLGHFVQEPFTPGHAISNSLFHELFPDPNPNRNIKLHWGFDSAGGDFPPPKPMLLGQSIPEAANRLFSEMFKGLKKGYQFIEPVIQSVYRGEPKSSQQAILMGQSQLAAQATASAWHTAFCIAFDRFNEEERKASDSLLLTDLPYYGSHLNRYETLCSGYVTDDQDQKVPMTVITPEGEHTFTDGFSLYGHGAVKYFLNGAYSRFRFGLALPSRVLRGQDEHTLLDFTVETDDKENLVYSEDVIYHGNVILREEIQVGFALKWFDLDIKGAISLIISSRSASWTDENGVVCFTVPDIVIVEPRLIK
ncbi:MAG: hypothetical protein IKP00_09570 [Victivallales bacterium]|nr:hypothetical protein [Victivallales bacterium]